MDIAALLRDFAFSQYESACYLALLNQHPANGSQISKLSGIARSRIYDVLRSLGKKGLVFEVDKGLYVPLPFTELKKRLRSQFESNLAILEEQLSTLAAETSTEYLLTLKGYAAVMTKARDIITAARHELYIRIFPNTWEQLSKALDQAMHRGVGVRFIAMGAIPRVTDIQVVHPDADGLRERIGGESIDIIADKSEALVGVFETAAPEQSPIIWTRNRSFVTTNRDSLQHDFYHYFLHRTYEEKAALSDRDKKIYEFIKHDD
ncbi:MAG: helix-turn-helix domain-containing protein [Pseudomonadota bacterium]